MKKQFFTVGYSSAERRDGWYQMTAKWSGSPQEAAEQFIEEMGGPFCEVHCQDGERITYEEVAEGYPDQEILDRYVVEINRLDLFGNIITGKRINEPYV